MKKSELVNNLNKVFDFNNQEEWDYCGSNNYIDENVNNVLISLDITNEVIDIAIKNNCNTIITHHPIMIDKLNNDNNLINDINIQINKKLIDNNILHICLHTCFDRYKFGTSYQIFKSFNFKNDFYCDEKWETDYIYSFKLNESMSLKDFLKIIDNKFTNPIVYIKEQENNQIKSIAIGAGSCSGMLSDIKNKNFDLFLTGDIKWHGYIDAYNMNISIANINHYSEGVFVDYICEYIKINFQLNCIKKEFPIKLVSISN